MLKRLQTGFLYPKLLFMSHYLFSRHFQLQQIVHGVVALYKADVLLPALGTGPRRWLSLLG